MSSEFGLPERTLTCIRTILAEHPAIERAILYGSRAKGSYKNGSDIDLTLIGAGLDLSTQFAVAGALDDAPIPYTVDLSIFTQISNPNLVEHIERVGKVFYQRRDQGQSS